MSHPRSGPSHFGRIALIFALAVLLAGCFTSKSPKFPLSTAVPALGDGGRYGLYERKDGKFVREQTITVRRRADGAYEFVSADGEVTPASLHRIGPERYVAQGYSKNDKQNDYAVLEIRGNEVLGYAPACDAQDQEKLKALGVEIGKYRCAIDRVADPMALFRGLELGEPSTKLVRE